MGYIVKHSRGCLWPSGKRISLEVFNPVLAASTKVNSLDPQAPQKTSTALQRRAEYYGQFFTVCICTITNQAQLYLFLSNTTQQ